MNDNDDPSPSPGEAQDFPDIAIDIAVAAGGWRESLPNAEAQADAAARAALAGAATELPASVELSITLGDDALLRDLNRRFRGKDRPTNVLAFALDEAPAAPGQPLYLGDVVLALETLTREAAAQAKRLDHHLAHLVVHACLHLLGHDHDSAETAQVMEDRERRVLAGLGIADPYAGETDLAEAGR